MHPHVLRNGNLYMSIIYVNRNIYECYPLRLWLWVLEDVLIYTFFFYSIYPVEKKEMNVLVMIIFKALLNVCIHLCDRS